MADEVKVQDAMQSDFSVVVNDIAEELLTRLNRMALLSTCSKQVLLILGNYSCSLAL